MSIFGKAKDWIEVPMNRLVVGHTIRKNRNGAWQTVESVDVMPSGLYRMKAGGHLYLNIKPTEKYQVKAKLK